MLNNVDPKYIYFFIIFNSFDFTAFVIFSTYILQKLFHICTFEYFPIE